MAKKRFADFLCVCVCVQMFFFGVFNIACKWLFNRVAGYKVTLEHTNTNTNSMSPCPYPCPKSMSMLMTMQFSVHVWARAHFFSSLVHSFHFSNHLSSFGCKRQDVAKVLFLCTLALQFRNWNLYSHTHTHSVKVISYTQANQNKFVAFNFRF